MVTGKAVSSYKLDGNVSYHKLHFVELAGARGGWLLICLIETIFLTESNRLPRQRTKQAKPHTLILVNGNFEMAQPIEQLIAIVEHVRSKVDRDTDIVWTRYSSVDELLADLDLLIVGILASDSMTYAKLELLFAPTGSFQELAMSNGWGDEFLELAQSFDNQIALVKSSS